MPNHMSKRMSVKLTNNLSDDLIPAVGLLRPLHGRRALVDAVHVGELDHSPDGLLKHPLAVGVDLLKHFL